MNEDKYIDQYVTLYDGRTGKCFGKIEEGRYTIAIDSEEGLDIVNVWEDDIKGVGEGSLLNTAGYVGLLR